MVETIPEDHCVDCHAHYFDGRKVLSPGYLLDIFKAIQAK